MKTPRNTQDIIVKASRTQTAVPAFNIPFLPMMAPVVEALRDCRSFGLIAVARLEWEKFGAGSLRAIRNEYERVKDQTYTRLHLDHVPVIDEDGHRVDYEPIMAEAIDLGYESVMIDGSRLDLEGNIAATRKVVEMAHEAGIPAEAELGAILGHEKGPLPPYEELFASRKGFTDPDQARQFVRETGVDWLSIAVGNIHGSIEAAAQRQEKIAARLDIEHLDRLAHAAGVPLVLHGGTGIAKSYILEAIRHGVAKINVATAIRRPYLAAREVSVEKARRAVYDATRRILEEDLDLVDSASTLARTQE